MKNFNFKSFVIIFFIIMTFQFLVGLIDILLFREYSQSSPITSALITIFSLPISLINKDLPFYVAEELYMLSLYWILNVVIQSMAVYGMIRVFKRLKNRESRSY